MSNTFHAHVYFDPETKRYAKDIHKYFTDFNGSIYYKDVKVGQIHDDPIGPHTKGQFQLAFGLQDLGQVVYALMLKRNPLSVLVHPETGHDVFDHTVNAFWMGDKVPLLLAKL